MTTGQNTANTGNTRRGPSRTRSMGKNNLTMHWIVGISTAVAIGALLFTGSNDNPTQDQSDLIKKQNDLITSLKTENANIRADASNGKKSDTPDFYTQVVKMENNAGGVSTISPLNAYLHRETPSVIKTIGRDCNFDIPTDTLGDDDWAEIDTNQLWNDPDSTYYNKLLTFTDGDCDNYNNHKGHKAAAKAIDMAMRDAKKHPKDQVINYLIEYEKAANGLPENISLTRVIGADIHTSPENRSVEQIKTFEI